MRAASDDARAAISRLSSAAQIAAAHDGIGLLWRASVTANDKGFLAPFPGVLPAASPERMGPERCANAAVHTFGRAPNFKRGI
jgi:hypothetical protein